MRKKDVFPLPSTCLELQDSREPPNLKEDEGVHDIASKKVSKSKRKVTVLKEIQTKKSKTGCRKSLPDPVQSNRESQSEPVAQESHLEGTCCISDARASDQALSVTTEEERLGKKKSSCLGPNGEQIPSGIVSKLCPAEEAKPNNNCEDTTFLESEEIRTKVEAAERKEHLHMDISEGGSETDDSSQTQKNPTSAKVSQGIQCTKVL